MGKKKVRVVSTQRGRGDAKNHINGQWFWGGFFFLYKNGGGGETGNRGKKKKTAHGVGRTKKKDRQE